MPKSELGGDAADSSSPPERVCILVVDAIIDEIEVEICFQRTDGDDRAFSTSMGWLHAERPSESTLVDSVETLMVDIIARCLRCVGDPVDARAGLLGKGHVWAIINSVYLEMGETKNENELWRDAKVVTKAAQLGLAPQASHFSIGTWIGCCPGTSHTLELQPRRNLFHCYSCKVGGGVDELDEFVAQRRNTAVSFIGRRTLH